MKVGWIGLGRLGLPCALKLADVGHDVVGYDINPKIRELWEKGDGFDGLGYIEPGIDELADRVGGAPEHFCVTDSIDSVVNLADVIFVAVQTPHAPEYDGTVPVPATTRDFEYSYLVQAVREVARCADMHMKHVVVVVVSTVLPSTCNRLIRPILTPYTELVYSPQFIAMGTTIRDFCAPEFLLLGCDATGTHTAVAKVSDVFSLVHDAPRMTMSVTDAEMVKVAYNTFISMKIVWANHLAMMCDATGADADAVVETLSEATQRVVSPLYLRPGMGDGGACHPRDLIALADLERRHDLPPLFTNLAQWRDLQSQHLAELVHRWQEQAGVPVAVLGRAYKRGTPLQDGSPALLLLHQLQALGLEPRSHDPAMVHAHERLLDLLEHPHVYLIGMDHPEYDAVTYPPGSVVIDPWGSIGQRDPGVTYVTPGRR